jgi:hypothetical protein
VLVEGQRAALVFYEVDTVEDDEAVNVYFEQRLFAPLDAA